MSASPEADASMGDGTAAAQAPAPCAAAARSEWLAWRGRGLGASDVSAVLNLSPWSSPWKLWAEKTGLLEADFDESEDMEFGKRAESMLKGYFEDRTGLYVAGEQQRCEHPDEPWMRCTVDGWVFDHPGDTDDRMLALGLVEFKKTADSPKVWEEEGIPVHYQCQASWAMAVTGARNLWFGVLHLPFGHPKFRVYEFVRDADDEALIVERCRRFWFDHVLAQQAPPADGHRATTDALAHAWEADDEATVAADVRLVDRVAKLAQLKAERKQIDADIELIENEIRAALGEATSLVDGDRVLCTWREQSATRLDGKALKAAEPEVWEKYAVTSASRVLRLKGAA